MGRLRSLDLATLRSALWAFRAARSVQRQLKAVGMEAFATPPAPSQARSLRGVHIVLYRGGYTCLVRAKVLQAWHAAYGQAPDLVIGVTSPAAAFRAHAWLDGDGPRTAGFEELLRRPSRPPSGGRTNGR